MRLFYKLTLAMIVPAALIGVVGFYASQVSERSLRQAIEETSAAQSRTVMDDIDRAIHTRIANWEAYVRSDLVQDSLAKSGRKYQAMPDPASYINEQDLAWQQTPSHERSPLMVELLTNPQNSHLSLHGVREAAQSCCIALLNCCVHLVEQLGRFSQADGHDFLQQFLITVG